MKKNILTLSMGMIILFAGCVNQNNQINNVPQQSEESQVQNKNIKPQTPQTKQEELDFSCNKDEDCVMKITGCNCCGDTYACLNINSSIGVCDLPTSQMNCACINLRPTSCECVNNKCESN